MDGSGNAAVCLGCVCQSLQLQDHTCLNQSYAESSAAGAFNSGVEQTVVGSPGSTLSWSSPGQTWAGSPDANSGYGFSSLDTTVANALLAGSVSQEEYNRVEEERKYWQLQYWRLKAERAATNADTEYAVDESASIMADQAQAQYQEQMLKKQVMLLFISLQQQYRRHGSIEYGKAEYAFPALCRMYPGFFDEDAGVKKTRCFADNCIATIPLAIKLVREEHTLKVQVKCRKHGKKICALTDLYQERFSASFINDWQEAFQEEYKKILKDNFPFLTSRPRDVPLLAKELLDLVALLP